MTMLEQKIEVVCLQGPKVLNGIAPTQAALNSFLADFGIFPVFPDMTFITSRRIPREAFDAFHYDDPNQFIPQGYIGNPVTDPEMMVVLADGSNAIELTVSLSTAERTYKRTEVQRWRNDAVSACIDIANRFNVDSRVIAEFKKLIETPKEEK